jgi:hypothetical protein
MESVVLLEFIFLRMCWWRFKSSGIWGHVESSIFTKGIVIFMFRVVQELKGIKLLLNISTNAQVYMVLLVEDWKLLK